MVSHENMEEMITMDSFIPSATRQIYFITGASLAELLKIGALMIKFPLSRQGIFCEKCMPPPRPLEMHISTSHIISAFTASLVTYAPTMADE